jgi:hypothetical protein
MNENVISLADAQAWAKLWRKQNPSSVKAFLIPNVDLLELLGEKPSQGDGYNVRAYVGIDPTDLVNSPKLMLVAVDAKGTDLIDYANGQYIYDFTQPCPKVCDDGSPLFQL